MMTIDKKSKVYLYAAKLQSEVLKVENYQMDQVKCSMTNSQTLIKSRVASNYKYLGRPYLEIQHWLELWHLHLLNPVSQTQYMIVT